MITGDANVDRLRRVSPLRATYALIILTATRQLNSISRPMPYTSEVDLKSKIHRFFRNNNDFLSEFYRFLSISRRSSFFE